MVTPAAMDASRLLAECGFSGEFEGATTSQPFSGSYTMFRSKKSAASFSIGYASFKNPVSPVYK